MRLTDRVYLAQLNTANGDDSSEFVVGILADTDSQAEQIAQEHEAEILSLHDGSSFYEIVNAPTTSHSNLRRSDITASLDKVSRGARVLLEAALRQRAFSIGTWCPSSMEMQEDRYVLLSHADMHKIIADWGATDEASFSIVG